MSARVERAVEVVGLLDKIRPHPKSETFGPPPVVQ